MQSVKIKMKNDNAKLKITKLRGIKIHHFKFYFTGQVLSSAKKAQN